MNDFGSYAGHPEPGAVRPAVQTWRTTTAVRVFALALCTGNLISDRQLVASIPALLVLVMLAAASSFLEWSTRTRPRHWYAVGEAVITVTLVVITDRTSDMSAYLAVPPIVAGVRHGLVTSINVAMVAAVTATVTILVDEEASSRPPPVDTFAWLVVGLGVGILASWQSRSTRDLAARHAPHAAAHQLVASLHRLARSGSLGLDATALATDLDMAMREGVGCARATVFLLDPTGLPRPLNGSEDAERLSAEIALAPADRTPGAAVVPLRGAGETLGYCVLVGVPRWTDELGEAALNLADEFAVRLDTAVLFDDVRALATAEERNRIAREMHDGVAQEIVGLGYLVDELETLSSDGQAKALAATLRAEITRLVSEIRFSIFDLRHHAQDGRLSSTLAEYAREVRRSTELHVHLSLSESGPPLAARTAAEVLRIAQESINNVRKHARADNLWVTLTSDRSRLELTVEDDGVGHARARDHHWGLQTMHERARGIGGQLHVTPRDHGGTSVRLDAPVTTKALEGNSHDHHRAAG
ncbi:sensor histidine kinase [Nocardia sp. N13]|uniref:sensor histidine kinase n=1 Tax=Nocardioides sp. N13(2025) TaxID=3453405 RepID=UPI003F7650B1